MQRIVHTEKRCFDFHDEIDSVSLFKKLKDF